MPNESTPPSVSMDSIVRLLECPECGDEEWTDNPRVNYCGVCAGDCGRDVQMNVKAKSDGEGWISGNDALPPEGREDIQSRWSEIGTAKGGVPTHWRFIGKV